VQRGSEFSNNKLCFSPGNFGSAPSVTLVMGTTIGEALSWYTMLYTALRPPVTQQVYQQRKPRAVTRKLSVMIYSA